MEFFDRKQEVIDIQLTPYGKYLLSKGKLRPKFYAFFDKDVIYDSFYGGLEENQKEISDRIKSAVRPKARGILNGVESNFLRLTEDYEVSDKQGTWMPPSDFTLPSIKPNNQTRNIKAYNLPIGNSDLNSSYYPSFDVNFFVGNISSSFNEYTGSLGGAIDSELIPQINCTVNFTTAVKTGGIVFEDNEEPADATFGANIIEPGLSSEPEEDRTYSPDVYKDGTYVTIKTRQLIFDLIEKYIPLEKEDFDLEVFEVRTLTKTDSGTSYEYESLKQMKFIRDDLGEELVNYGDSIYNRSTKETFEINQGFVEYYFDLRVDNEIELPISEPSISISQAPNPEEPCADE
jgi:hypothetical protein